MLLSTWLLVAAGLLLASYPQVDAQCLNAVPTFTPSTYVSPYNFFSTPQDLVATQHITGDPIAPREAGSYSDDGRRYMQVVGGFNNGTGLGFNDVYVLDTVADANFRCSNTQLPSAYPAIYYAQGDFHEDLQTMFIVSGVISQPNAAVTYATDMLAVNFAPGIGQANPCTGVTANTITLSPPVQPRQMGKAMFLGNVLYVFGGVQASAIGSAASYTSITSAIFYSITVTGVSGTAQTKVLSMSPSAYVTPARIDPLMLIDTEQDEIFFYSGWTSWGAFESTHFMYKYDNQYNVWLPPLQPLLNIHSSILGSYPDIVFAAASHSPDTLQNFFIGGMDSGGHSGDQIVHIDSSTEDLYGAPTITVLYPETPVHMHGGMAGINYELDLFIIAGCTVDPSGTKTYLTSSSASSAPIYEAILPILAPSAVSDFFAQTTTQLAVDDTYEFGTANLQSLPVQREGAAYGSWEGVDAIVFAGGAVITSESILALTDVWFMSLINDIFVQSTTSLPTPSYHGVSWFVVDQSSLYLWGGRTNTVGPNIQNTYNNAMYRIDYSNIGGDYSKPTVTQCTLTGTLAASLQGVQYASVIEMHDIMYIFGGLNGLQGNTIPNGAQQWFSIDLTSTQYVTKQLSHSGSDYPASVYINPTLFTEASERYVYMYSGMAADAFTWNNPFAVSIYDTKMDQWMPAIEPFVSAFSGAPQQLPNIVFAGRALSLDDQHTILVGGNLGTHSPIGSGTTDQIVHIDASPLQGNELSGNPIITVLPSKLMYAVQSPIVALEYQDTEVVIFSGSVYANTLATFPTLYIPYVQELTQLNHIPISQPIASGGIPSSSSSSSSSNSLSNGAVAGICIGVLIGAFLIAIVAFCLGRMSGNGGSYGKRRGDIELGDSSSSS